VAGRLVVAASARALEQSYRTVQRLGGYPRPFVSDWRVSLAYPVHAPQV